MNGTSIGTYSLHKVCLRRLTAAGAAYILVPDDYRTVFFFSFPATINTDMATKLVDREHLNASSCFIDNKVHSPPIPPDYQ